MTVKRVNAQCDSILEASNGLEAVNTVVELLSQGKILNGVLIDNSMPVMNGVEATKLIREAGYRGKMIMITGNALQADIQLALNAGIDVVYVKPLRKEDFISILKGLINVLVQSYSLLIIVELNDRQAQ